MALFHQDRQGCPWPRRFLHQFVKVLVLFNLIYHSDVWDQNSKTYNIPLRQIPFLEELSVLKTMAGYQVPCLFSSSVEKRYLFDKREDLGADTICWYLLSPGICVHQ